MHNRKRAKVTNGSFFFDGDENYNSFLFFFLMIRRPPRSPLFPYTPFFRSAGQPLATPRSLASLNLDGLKRIEAIGAGLIAAIGVAVLGAFLVLERRREFAVLEAVGAEDR